VSLGHPNSTSADWGGEEKGGLGHPTLHPSMATEGIAGVHWYPLKQG
jgi:hypothetical protein